MGASALGVLRFRVLGALQAIGADGEPVRLGGERQRALLALLLLHAGEPVSVEQLVEELFGGDRSETAVGSVRVAVSRLRRLLDVANNGGVVATRAGGYVLEARPEEVDAARFERLAKEGREALRAGEASSAVELLRNALSLWRGPPYADVAQLEFVQAEIRRLEELRMVALMDRIDADLALGRSGELIGEIETLITENPLQERLRAQLMLALYRSGRQADALAVYRQTGELLRDELGLEPSPALQELEGAILRQDPELAPASTPPPAETTILCPFKGLASFDRYDAEYFCGRERLVSELVAALAETTLVGIVGPSGIGKSSLLRAGVLPALAAGALPGSSTLRQVLLRPGEDPGQELEDALGPGGLTHAMISLAPGERLLLAVDQLEEVFTLCPRPEERAEFLAQLAAAASDTGGRALVLVALRADFYGRCASYPEFARALSRSHVLVGPMARAELAEAIELPAARAGLEVDRSLVDSLVADVEGEPGGLPLLSTTLLELWRERDGRRLSYERYRASGGVRGAVARLAEDAYTGLDAEGQRVARSLMLRLAAGEEGSLVRRRVPLVDIERLAGAEPVLAVLTDARLLTVSEGAVEISHEALMREWPRYRGWLEEDRIGRRLHAHLSASAREWEARSRDAGELYRGARLAAAADWAAQHELDLDPLEREFIAASRAAAEREARRQRVQNRRLRALLTGVAVLLVLSVTAGVIALVKQNTASDEARAALAGKLGAEAVNQPRIDLAMLLAREAVNLDRTSDTESTLLSTLLRSPAAIGTFALPIDSRPQSVTVSPNGRTLLVPDNNGNLRIYDAITHGRQRPPLRESSLTLPVYSPDGSLLVYPSGSGFAVRNARTYAPEATLTITDHSWLTAPTNDNDSLGTLISPDDRTVYYPYWVLNQNNGNPGQAYLDRWSLPSGRPLPRIGLGQGPVSARLLDKGRQLVVLGASGVTRFAIPALNRLSTRPIALPPASQLTAGAISVDGASATVGTAQGSVDFVDLNTGQVRPGTGGHGEPVIDIAYSPTRRVVVSTGNDGQVRVWNPATAVTSEVLSGHGGEVHGAAFSPDGSTLYTSSLDGVVFEWDLGGHRRFGRPFSVGRAVPCCGPASPGTPPFSLSPSGDRFAARTGPLTVGLFSTLTLAQVAEIQAPARAGVITALAWSPSGRQLVVAGENATVELWSVQGAPRQIRSLSGLGSSTGLPEAVQAVGFSPDGRRVVALDYKSTSRTTPPAGHLAVWRAADGSLVGPPRSLGAPGDSLAFLPDGKELVVGTDDGRLLILDSTGRTLEHRLWNGPAEHGVHDSAVSLAFAPDGTLAVGGWSGIVRQWDSASWKPVGHPLLVAAAPAASISFDPSSQRFATAGADGTVKLWSSSSLQEIGSTLASVSGSWGDLRFTPGGRELIAVHDDGTGEVWPMTVDAWKRHACAVAGRNLTLEEWSRFVTGYSYTRVCP